MRQQWWPNQPTHYNVCGGQFPTLAQPCLSRRGSLSQKSQGVRTGSYVLVKPAGSSYPFICNAASKEAHHRVSTHTKERTRQKLGTLTGTNSCSHAGVHPLPGATHSMGSYNPPIQWTPEPKSPRGHGAVACQTTQHWLTRPSHLSESTNQPARECDGTSFNPC